MPFVWDEKTMGTGVPEIDAQHQELIRRLQRLLAALKEGRGEHEIRDTLDFVGQYAAWHFGQEEECMQRDQCPVVASARSAHKHFLESFRDLSERVKAEGPKMSLTIRAERELADWVRHHIIRIDTQIKKCVQERASAVGEAQPA